MKNKDNKKATKKKNNEEILVMIAAYCDPELLNTIHSALVQADDKARVHFVVCFQSDNLDDLNELKKVKNCRIIHLKESEAKGSCYARYLCQKEIKDEKYIFMIDSHMRFVKHWDTKMIEQLESIGDPKAILSSYPPFCTEEMMALPLDDPTYDKPGMGSCMYAIKFKTSYSYLMDFTSFLIDKDNKFALKRNPFMSANNFFSYAEAQKEVLFDKEMFFYGDELPMAVRFFTHGWNIYNPAENYVYHKYQRKEQKMPQISNAIINEMNRYKALIGLSTNKIDFKEFGLGNVRTFKEYEDFSGVDFKNRIIHMSSEVGDFENERMKNKISYFQSKRMSQEKLFKIQPPIYVIIIDKYNNYQECIKSCVINANCRNNLRFLVASTSSEDDRFPYKNFIKKFIHIDEFGLYGRYLSNLCQFLKDGFVAVVESSFIFVKGWDLYYSDNLKKADINGVLTSWVWKSNENKDEYTAYLNIVKEYDGFYGYLPRLKYNDNVNLYDRKKPYQTGFISDGFMFCSSNVFKKVLPDPNLSYIEHTITYSVRLWTNGINIYYPTESYLVRLKDDSELNENIYHNSISSCILGIYNGESKTLEQGYRYDNGNVRPLWTWYEFIGEPGYNITDLNISEKK